MNNRQSNKTAVRQETNELMKLFCTDGTEYHNAGVRWVLSAMIEERSTVVFQWGLDDNRLCEEVILELMELHQDAWIN